MQLHKIIATVQFYETGVFDARGAVCITGGCVKGRSKLMSSGWSSRSACLDHRVSGQPGRHPY